MRHFHRTQLTPAEVLVVADSFFPSIGVTQSARQVRGRSFSGALGTITLDVRPEGGHYTFVEAVTDQMGESRLDKNVKKFFLQLHRQQDPSHKLQASF